MIKLTKKINGSFKSKLNSHTPINIAISKKDSDMIKKGPREAFDKLLKGQGTPQIWYTLMFRTEATRIIASQLYTDETVTELTSVRDVCVKLMDRYIQERKWNITEQEQELLLAGLDAADQVQDDNTRRVHLDAYKKADAFVKKLAIQAEQRLDEMSKQTETV